MRKQNGDVTSLDNSAKVATHTQTSTLTMKKAYDVIIVGAGHNGLVTSAYLARKGLRVLVCEKRPIIGGAACTEEIVPGFKFSRASYLLSLFRPKIIDDLNLREHGLKYYFRDPCSYTPLKKPLNNDQRSLLLSSSNSQFNREQIARFSPNDAQKLHQYEEWLTKICRALDVSELDRRFVQKC